MPGPNHISTSYGLQLTQGLRLHIVEGTVLGTTPGDVRQWDSLSSRSHMRESSLLLKMKEYLLDAARLVPGSLESEP